MAIIGESYFERTTVFGQHEILSYQTDTFGSIPRIVYKYLDMSLAFNRNSLEENYLWFGDPTAFNDPFDCKTTFAYHLLAEDEFQCRNYYEFTSREKEPNLSDDERKFAVDQNVARILKNKSNVSFFKEFGKNALSSQLEGIKQFGVFCTCMINDNILLWSHYANKHRGICLGLKVDKILEKFHADGDLGAGEIKYDTFPLITPPLPNDQKAIIETFEPIFLTKAPCWNYELEYRFLDYPCVERKKSFDEILESIYMGCDISVEDECFVTEFCQKHRGEIKLYKAEKAFFKYGIEFNEVSF